MDSQEPASPELLELSEVSVENQEGTTVIGLLGLSDPDFESFEQADPARIVLDVWNMEMGAISDSVAVYDGTVDEVTITPFEGSAGMSQARIELNLASAATYEVTSLEDRLEIRLTPKDASAQAAETDEVAPAVVWTPASQVTGASAEAQAEGTLVVLDADGTIEMVEHFVLEDPSRLVVDIPGVSHSAAASQDFETADVARIRVGQHEDKVRVVIDGTEGADLADVAVVPSASGLVIAMGGATAPDPVASAVPAALAGDEEMAAMAAEAGEIDDDGAHIASEAGPEENSSDEAASDEVASEEADSPWMAVYGVQFDANEERSRVTISTSEEARFRAMYPDGDTFVLSLSGAELAPDADVRVAPAKSGPVSMVSAFQQPGEGDPEVRIVIRRANELAPTIDQQGSVLILDFAATGDVAAGVPMMAKTEGDDSAAAAIDAAGEAVPAALPDGVDGVTVLQEGGLLEGKRYIGRRISLDFKDVEIADVLRLIAEVSELNIIAGDEVKGEVTIRLVDVPWDQALDVILLTKGLGFVRVGNVLRIAPAGTLKAEEEARLQEKRAKERLEDLLVKLQPVNYADVKEVSKMVKRLLSSRGTVDVDVRTNTLILKDISSVINEATALVKAIDTQTPQVLIESKIVEAKLDFSRELGSMWAFGAQPNVDGFNSASGARRDLRVGDDVVFHDNPLLTDFTETFNHVSVQNPITSVANGILDLGAFLLDERLNIELRLEAAESNGEGKVISSPRIVTLDNRRATIEQGLAIPFQTFENGDAKLEFIDASLKLDVTPHITADRSIIMKIVVHRNAPDDSVPTPTGSPAIAKNEATTETLVKDGQTLVIGGIYIVDKTERQSRVPYFHSIPIVGNAFKNKEVSDSREELLVFVTPRIIQNPELGS